MHVRLRAVTRVAARSDYCALLYPLTNCDAHRSPSQVREKDEGPGWAEGQNDVISCNGRTALPDAPGLGERVWDQRQLRAAGLMIRLPVMCGSDSA
jgi:hypothetical protein